MSSSEILDRVHSLAAVHALEAAPEAFGAALASELATPIATLGELEARDATLAGALRRIDDTAVRIMRLRLAHALALDRSIAPPTRTVFASTVVSYADDLARLATRARDVAARGGASEPDAVAGSVVEAARATLAVRHAVRAGVLALIQALARSTLPEADRRARDRGRGDAERKRWSAARRDLEILAAEPARILVAPWPARLAAWPEQLDEPAPEPAPTRAELIELD